MNIATMPVNDPNLRVINSTLDSLHIQPGSLISRLTRLVVQHRTMKDSIATLMLSRRQAVEALGDVIKSKLTLPEDAAGPLADALNEYQTHVKVGLERVLADLATIEVDYLNIEPILELVKAARELSYNTEEVLSEMRQYFHPGDPLRKKTRDCLVNVDLNIAKLQELSGHSMVVRQS